MSDLDKTILDIARSRGLLNDIHPHYGSMLLFRMSKIEGVTLEALHGTAHGDRMVVKFDRDPNHVYELVLRPFKPDELAGDLLRSRLPSG